MPAQTIAQSVTEVVAKLRTLSHSTFLDKPERCSWAANEIETAANSLTTPVYRYRLNGLQKLTAALETSFIGEAYEIAAAATRAAASASTVTDDTMRALLADILAALEPYDVDMEDVDY